MAYNKFSSSSDNETYPSRNAYAVTPDDSNELSIIPKALYIGTGCNITLRSADATADVVLKNLASGQIIDIMARYVRATGTTASDIVAMA
jgi:hypothetical protein